MHSLLHLPLLRLPPRYVGNRSEIGLVDLSFCVLMLPSSQPCGVDRGRLLQHLMLHHLPKRVTLSGGLNHAVLVPHRPQRLGDVLPSDDGVLHCSSRLCACSMK